MKNKLIIALIVIAVVIVGAVLFFRQTAPAPSAGNENQAPPAEPGVAPSSPITQTQPSVPSTANFDANDNLDRAVQDLDAVK